MKITSAITFGVMPGVQFPDLEAIGEALATQAFVPCGPTQQSSAGFVAPREVNGALIESVAEQWIVKAIIETRAVPTSAIKKAVDAKIAAYKEETGRERVGGKIKKEFKEEAMLDLLPRAFPKQHAVGVWLDRKANLLTIDTSSQTKADIVASMLVQAIPGLGLTTPTTTQNPGVAMAQWLLDGQAPDHFTIDRDCELRASDGTGGLVRYANHSLDNPEIVEHIKRGYRPARLAMTYNDRVSFVLSDTGNIRSIRYLDLVMEGAAESKADEFDTDVTITTAELAVTLAAICEALGGVAQAMIGDEK